MKRARTLAAGTLALATAAALGYATAAVICLRRFERRAPDPLTTVPAPASVLVPLAGADPGLEENLRALAAQHVPEYQVVCGVHDAGDPALAVARRVAADVPAGRVVIAVGAELAEPPRARNPKIENLLAMLPLARHDRLVLVDADMRVTADYLAAVTAPLDDPAVGAVTCVYAGVPAAGLPSRLGAMFIGEQFVPSALLEAATGELRHAFGATIAVRRRELDAIGGLTALGPHLADDHELGRAVAGLGLRVVLSRYVVRTLVREDGWLGLWRHELRWHRTIRSVAPLGYAFMFLTYPTVLAAAWLLVAQRRRLPVTALGAALGLRLMLQRRAAGALGVAPGRPWLIPLRDAFGFLVWAAGLRGRNVRWRRESLDLTRGDRLADR